MKILTVLLALFFSQAQLMAQGENQDANVHDYHIRSILQLEVNSSINPATLNYFRTAYKRAQQESFDLVLITINTPGGLVSTTKDILTLIGDAEFPTAIWVKPEGASATSAGAIIASAAHLLYMSEGTNIGAATPVQMGGDIEGDQNKENNDVANKEESSSNEKAPQTIQERLAQELKKNQEGGGDMRAKAVNDLVALIQSLSEARGRNAELYAEMIRNAASFKAREAYEEKLIDGIANNLEDIVDHLNGREVVVKGKTLNLSSTSPRVVTMQMDLGQKLLDIFANPGLAYILFLIGAALIYLELQAPGGFIAGSIGVVCIIMAGIGFQVLPLDFGALGLIVFSFLLFVMEIYVTSYGVLSLAGLAALISGSLFLYRGDDGYLELSHSFIFSSVSAVLVFMGLIAYMFIRDRKVADVADFNAVVGKHAVVMSEISSTEPDYFFYQVKVNGEIWRARSKKQVQVHATVTITGNDQQTNTLDF